MKTFNDLADPEVAAQLKSGAIGILLTDTVYGLAACATDELAVTRLYALKHREHKPGTVIAASVEQLIDLGLNRENLETVKHYWPNPLSVVLPAGEELAYLHQGQGSLAVRIPSNKALLDLLIRTGPIVTSSANDPGEPTATNILEAKGYFGDKVNFYVNGGQHDNPVPSTVIKVQEDGGIKVLRIGATPIDEN